MPDPNIKLNAAIETFIQNLQSRVHFPSRLLQEMEVVIHRDLMPDLLQVCGEVIRENEAVETNRITWLAQDPIDRLEDVRFRVVNTRLDLRAAIDESMANQE